MWPRDDLRELLGIEHPIIQAPMAAYATPALAAAVSNAGGLGSLGCGEMSPDTLAAVCAELRAATDRPFNLNFFAHPEPRHAPEVAAEVRARLAGLYRERGLGALPEDIAAPFGAFDQEILSTLLEIRPPVVSFHFGLPAPDRVAALQDAGVVILCTATTVAESVVLAECGVDAIIAQGWEAGGHRGTFHAAFEDFGVGTLALVPQIADAVGVPVVAAGGIADGRGIAAAFHLGASGVQMGTAFLSCPEADVAEEHRAALRAARDDDTRLSRAFSGRPARTQNNPYVEMMAERRARLPDFPLMYALSVPLMRSSAARGDSDFRFLLYGQAAALNRELPADELMARLVEEARGLLYPA